MVEERPIPTAANKAGQNSEGETQEGQTQGTGGGTTSPEGILMLCLAGIIDLISLIPMLNFLSTVFGIIFIGGWLVITRPSQALQKVIKKFLIAAGIEIIPIVSIAPSWTMFVYSAMKDE